MSTLRYLGQADPKKVNAITEINSFIFFGRFLPFLNVLLKYGW